MDSFIEQRIRKGTPQPALSLPQGTLDKVMYRRMVAQRAKQARLDMGLTLYSVAKITRIPRNNLSRFENSVGIDAHTMYVLERLYGIDLDGEGAEDGRNSN